MKHKALHLHTSMLQLTHMCITIYVCVNFFVAPFNCLAGIILLFFVVIVFFFCLSLLKLDLFYPYRLPIYCIYICMSTLRSYTLCFWYLLQSVSVWWLRGVKICTGKVFGFNICAIATQLAVTVGIFVVAIVGTSHVINKLQYTHTSTCIYTIPYHTYTHK